MIKVLRRLGQAVLGIEPIAADRAEFGSDTGLVSMSGAFPAHRMPWLANAWPVSARKPPTILRDTN